MSEATTITSATKLLLAERALGHIGSRLHGILKPELDAQLGMAISIMCEVRAAAVLLADGSDKDTVLARLFEAVLDPNKPRSTP